MVYLRFNSFFVLLVSEKRKKASEEQQSKLNDLVHGPSGDLRHGCRPLQRVFDNSYITKPNHSSGQLPQEVIAVESSFINAQSNNSIRLRLPGPLKPFFEYSCNKRS
jgi:hypothetical protein